MAQNSQQMRFVKGSSVYNQWESPDLPVLIKIYFFNITNADEVKTGKKPLLKQLGPYSFRETIQRVDIQHHPQNGTVSYRRKHFWYFEPSHSAGFLEDNVTTVNFPLMAAIMNVKSMSTFAKYGLFYTINTFGVEPFVTHSVRELLFDGYDDILLSMASALDSNSNQSKFGWLFNRNGSSLADGVYNTFTGASDPKLLGVIHSHNYQTRTHFDGNCGQIRGSAEGFFPLFSDIGNGPPQELELYTRESCRYHFLFLTYNHAKIGQNVIRCN